MWKDDNSAYHSRSGDTGFRQGISGGKDVTALAPEARDVNTVFQNYALFPHMTVADNIGYGLKLKKIPKAEIKKRVSEMLELVQLPGYEKRKPLDF